MNSAVLRLTLSIGSLGGILILSLSMPLIAMTNILPPAFHQARPYSYCVCFLMALAGLYPFRENRMLQVVPWPVLATLLWFWSSLIWSDRITDSFGKVILITLLTASIFLTIEKAGYRRSLNLVRMILALTLVLNYAMLFVFPGQAFSDITSKTIYWQGFMANKNIAGMTCALTIIFFFFDSYKLNSSIRWIFVALASVFLVESNSRTSMIGCVVALLIGAAIQWGVGGRVIIALRKHAVAIRLAAIGMGCVLLLASLTLTFQRDILIGTTENLVGWSNRNTLWRPVLQYFVDHPLTGSGYGAFWRSNMQVHAIQEFGGGDWLSRVDQAHNGYLDILVQTGLPGGVLLLFAVIAWPADKLGTVLMRQPRRGALAYAILVFCLVDNTMESSLFIRDTICNVSLLISLAFIKRLTSGSPVERRRVGTHPRMAGPIKRRSTLSSAQQ